MSRITVPEKVTSRWLNSLTVKERIRFFQETGFELDLQKRAAEHIASFWFVGTNHDGVTEFRNGTIFFVRTPQRILGVTAAHVVAGYMDFREVHTDVVCRLDNMLFNPIERLIAPSIAAIQNAQIDIATFAIEERDLEELDMEALSAHSESWDLVHPFSGQGAIICGYPAALRLQTDPVTLNFGIFMSSMAVNAASDRSITFPFNRAAWVDTLGHGFAPEGMHYGGLSGGPILMPFERDGVWDLHLAGVVKEGPTQDIETIVGTPAHFIAPDGTLYGPDNWPIRHAVKAE